MTGRNYVDFYGVRVEYDIYQDMGVFEPVTWISKDALAYKPTTPIDIAMEVRMCSSREAGIEHLIGILRSPVREDWVPPAQLAGQPPNLNAVRPQLNNSSDFAMDALVALGEMEPARKPRHRRIA